LLLRPLVDTVWRFPEIHRPSKEDMVAFSDYLIKHGLLCTIRDSKGIDISAACGQLKEKDAQSN